MASGEFYPDILVDACNLYQPVLTTFGQILRRSESSEAFYRNIYGRAPVVDAHAVDPDFPQVRQPNYPRRNVKVQSRYG